MLTEAWYDNGKIELTGNHRFKHTRFKLRVVVPDEELELEVIPESAEPESVQQPTADSPASEQYVSPTRARLDAILGPWRSKLGGAITPQEVKDIWHQHLEEKYLGTRH